VPTPNVLQIFSLLRIRMLGGLNMSRLRIDYSLSLPCSRLARRLHKKSATWISPILFPASAFVLPEWEQWNVVEEDR